MRIYSAIENAVYPAPKDNFHGWWKKPRLAALRRAALRRLTSPWLEEFDAAVAKAGAVPAATTFAGASKNAVPIGAPPAADVAAGAATSAGAPKTAPTEQAKALKDKADTKTR